MAGKYFAHSLETMMARTSESNGCREWQGWKDKDGYGKIKIRGKVYRAHRVVWTAAYGEIPDGLMVLHKCDNPPCCNPEHLFLGTGADNMKDRARKKRYNHTGVNNPRAKLTDTDILAIRSDNRTATAIAAQYGVASETIGHIIKGRGWKHIPKASPDQRGGTPGTHGYGGSSIFNRRYSGNKLCSLGIFEWVTRASGTETKRGVTKVRVIGYEVNRSVIEQKAKEIVLQLDAGTYSGPRWVRIPGNY